MGCDTKAIISKSTTLTDVVDHLKTSYKEVKVHTTCSNDFFQISFIDDENNRVLSCFFNNYALADYGIDGVLLSLGMWSNSVEIMQFICDKFGGYIDRNDCDEIGFEPYNLYTFNSEINSPIEKFKLEIVNKVGFENLQVVLKLCEQYKNL